jgi:hypothetical protein
LFSFIEIKHLNLLNEDLDTNHFVLDAHQQGNYPDIDLKNGYLSSLSSGDLRPVEPQAYSFNLEGEIEATKKSP